MIKQDESGHQNIPEVLIGSNIRFIKVVISNE